MARVARKSVRGVRYIQVVEDYKDAHGQWRQKVLQSFGQETPESHLEAVQYAAAVNEFKKQADAKRGTQDWSGWEAAAAILIGAAALGWLLNALFDDD